MNINNFIPVFIISLYLACTANRNSSTNVQQKCTKKVEAIQTSDTLSTELLLIRMLDKKDIFKLETLLQEKRTELPQHIVLYLEANLQNAFNQTKQSLHTIDKLLGTYAKSLNDMLLYKTFVLKYDNLRKQYRYREAAEALEIAIEKYGHAVDRSEVIRLCEENYSLVNSVKDFPAQKMYITSDVSIPVLLNQYNHMIINVSSNGQSESFIFDTGASNVVSEGTARHMGLRILNSVGSMIGSADKKVPFKVGLADKLWIGDLLFENVVFKVLPDEVLSFPEANYVIHGIIGFPIMNQMKELEIYKNKNITVVAHPTKCNQRNLFLDNAMPIIQFEAKGDTLLFIMDTGANTTKFSKKYFTANKVEIKKKATSNTVRRGGIGGFVDNEVYELKDVQLKIGGQEMNIPNIVVLTDKLSYLENYDGHLGQDVLMHFNKLTLNFEGMYLSFDD